MAPHQQSLGSVCNGLDILAASKQSGHTGERGPWSWRGNPPTDPSTHRTQCVTPSLAGFVSKDNPLTREFVAPRNPLVFSLVVRGWKIINGSIFVFQCYHPHLPTPPPAFQGIQLFYLLHCGFARRSRFSDEKLIFSFYILLCCN